MNKHPGFCGWLCLFHFNSALELFVPELAVTVWGLAVFAQKHRLAELSWERFLSLKSGKVKRGAGKMHLTLQCSASSPAVSVS